MSFGNRALFEPLRRLAEPLLATYQPLETAAPIAPLLNQSRMLIIVNNLNTDILISFDAVNDHLFMPQSSQITLDFTSNEVDMNGLFIALGTTIYAKYSSAAATTGAVYASSIYAYGDN
jgi:hypothetical protein